MKIYLFILFFLSLNKIYADELKKENFYSDLKNSQEIYLNDKFAAKKDISTSSKEYYNIEFRGGYFYPNWKKFRNIYKNGGIDIEIEISRIFRENWACWANVNYFQKNGKSLVFHNKTNICIIPISLGLKYQFLLFNSISPYLGCGITYSILKVKNDFEFVKKSTAKSGFGFVIKSGFYIDLSKNLILDLFFDYSYQEINFYNQYNNMGGFKTGIGLGYRF